MKLKQNKTKPKIYAFDTEDNSKGKAFLFNFYEISSGTHHTFKNRRDALDFVFGHTRAIFWAVNLAYDINNLFRGEFACLNYTFAGSRLLQADIVDDAGKKCGVKFLDTLNHWPMSVKEMGKRIGLEKLEMKHTGRVSYSPKMIEYCKRDTEITGRFVEKMQKVYDKIGLRLKMTVASTALDFFQREYYGGKIFHQFTEEQIDFFHTGYYGGRTEIFFNKPIEGNIFYHDINSLYPAICRDGVFPHLSEFYETNVPNFEFEGVADVECIAPTGLNIPYLPARQEGKLIFPLGNFRGVYTYFEIREAKKLGYEVKNVYRAVEFTGTTNPFKKYIDDLYKLRLKAQKEKDDLMQLSFKNLMNHCYGKFAQGNEVEKLVPLKSHTLKSGDVILFDLVLTKVKEKYPDYANCIWSMYVTAQARHKLYEALNKVQNSGGLLLYCDTDSVIYEAPKQLLEDSKNLGEFKLENRLAFAHFKLPKLYAIREKKRDRMKIKAKGVPKSDEKGPTDKYVRNFFLYGTAKFKKPNKLRETLRRNLSPKNKIKLVPNFWEMREKSISQRYDKRIVDEKGFTRPIVLNN